MTGFYTFEVIDVNGNSVLYTDYLSTATPLGIPVLANPSDGATGVLTNVTFQWQAVAGANAYKLEVYEVDAVAGSRTIKVISSDTNQTSYNATMDTDTTYDWRVRARYFDPNDGVEYDGESRCSYARFTTAP